MPEKAAFTPALLLERLKSYKLLQGVPENQLQWLIRTGEVRKLSPGEKLFEQDAPIDRLFIVLKGSIQFKLEQQGEFRIISELAAGDISGALPFSRAKTSMAQAQAKEETHVLELSKERFHELVAEHTALTEALVHVMTSRVRDFTREQQQTEKLAALGRLSAGLHHELNNPAAAALRAAEELKTLLSATPQSLKDMLQLNLQSSQIDKINQLIFAALKQDPADQLGMLERSKLEEELSNWLELHSVKEPYAVAEVFASHQLQLSDLKALEETAGNKQAGPLAAWIYNVLASVKLVDEIRESSGRISKLVSAVKHFSHMDRGTEKERTDLAASIRNTLTLLHFKLKKKKIKVTLDAPDQLPQPCVFPGELNQVWTNLIDNAIDAMAENGQLEIRLQAQDGKLVIDVSDNGIGIPAEVQDRIFEPFFTTKGIDQGSGMGLEISRNIIRQHGGTLDVHSEPGKTTFSIVLPENSSL